MTVQRNKSNQKKISLRLNCSSGNIDKLMAFFQFIIFDVKNQFRSLFFSWHYFSSSSASMMTRRRIKKIDATYFEIRIDGLFFEWADYQQGARFDAYHFCIRCFFPEKYKKNCNLKKNGIHKHFSCKKTREKEKLNENWVEMGLLNEKKEDNNGKIKWKSIKMKWFRYHEKLYFHHHIYWMLCKAYTNIVNDKMLVECKIGFGARLANRKKRNETSFRYLIKSLL